MTAPKANKNENFYIPSRVPTSSSKYTDTRVPNLKVSIKGTGWNSFNPREPVRTTTAKHSAMIPYRETSPKIPLGSPSPEVFEHIWEEGSKRPKTQNEKSRKVKTGQVGDSGQFEVFPGKNTQNGGLYDVPIIVIRDDKNRRVVSAKRNTTAKGGKRPSTFKPGKSSLVTSLDQEFLELFEM